MKSAGKLPCELVIWYVLPDFRSEISRKLYEDYHFKQVEIAKLLGVTKAAVNQYLSSKRGDNFFNLIKTKKTKQMLEKEITNSASNIVKNESTIDVELCRLCNVIKGDKIIFKVYEEYAHGVFPKCLFDSDQSQKLPKSRPGKSKRVKCPGCNKLLEDEWIACPHCGKQVANQCTGCNSKLDLNWKVCPYCAKSVRKSPAKKNSRKNAGK